jgi:CheY-like chemotaxis protein
VSPTILTTSLGVILGNAELMAAGLDDERLLNHAATIERAALRGAELTHGLLAFSRRQSLDPQKIDLSKLVGAMTTILQRTLGETIEIVASFANAEVLTDVDPNQLENALLNLTLNARDAMPGGGALTIETSCAELDTDAARQIDATPGTYAVLSVADTGTGMPPEVLERVFEPFFTTKETGKGTGLGLSMIYGFVRQSKGQVTIDSTEGRGTVIRLYLPASESGVSSQTSAADSETTPLGQSKMLLLVEGDPDFHALSVELIKDLGYRVIVTENAAMALDALAAEPAIDLVLSDVISPGGKSGTDVARAVRAQRPELPVLFMSGYTADHLDAIRSEYGSDLPLISKAFSRRVLARHLHEALTGKPT